MPSKSKTKKLIDELFSDFKSNIEKIGDDMEEVTKKKKKGVTGTHSFRT